MATWETIGSGGVSQSLGLPYQGDLGGFIGVYGDYIGIYASAFNIGFKCIPKNRATLGVPITSIRVFGGLKWRPPHPFGGTAKLFYLACFS